jgi:hypothetical protein
MVITKQSPFEPLDPAVPDEAVAATTWLYRDVSQ